MSAAHPTHIYKIATQEEWAETLSSGTYPGAPVDLADGFVHFSTAAQVRETARRYFAQVEGLRLLEVEAAPLGGALKWEPSRGGDLFPHLYGTLAREAVIRDWALPCDGEGGHIWPPELEAALA